MPLGAYQLAHDSGMRRREVLTVGCYVWQAISQRDPYAPMGFDSASRSTLFYASANDRADCCEFLIDW